MHWSFLSLCFYGGRGERGVHLHLLISNSLQQREQDELGNSVRGTVWKQAAGCTALAMVGASVH